MKFDITKTSVRLFILVCLFFIIAGCVFRIWHVQQNEFVFYDEGFYLNHNRLLGEMIKTHYPLGTSDLHKAFVVYARTCMASGKSLWFFIADARIFFGCVHEWFWSRALACLFGLLTIFLTYCFAARFFQSRWTAWLSAVLLAVLPSHVFYSRVGLQEALSTFLVLIGFYFYLFPRKFSWRTFVAGFFFGLAFFSNYRLIMLPVLIGVTELWLSFAQRRMVDWRKSVWCVVVFFSMVFGIGGTLFGGVNTFIIFAWVFHQQYLAGPQFHWFNLLSYPYYLFRLEHWSFAVMFFAALWVLIRRKRKEAVFLVLSVVQMIIFSLPEEKGARYLCVVFPFLAMSVAYFIEVMFGRLKSPQKRFMWGLVVVMMFVFLTIKSSLITQAGSDYHKCADFLIRKDAGIKFLSSQKQVQDLYVSNPDQVQDIPHGFNGLTTRLSEGYTYLVLGPQAYLAVPEGEQRFALRLEGSVGYLREKFAPVQEFDHFNRVMLERFVFEHSSNLIDSTEFLRLADSRGFGKLYVYDLRQCVPAMMRMLFHHYQQMGAEHG